MFNATIDRILRIAMIHYLSFYNSTHPTDSCCVIVYYVVVLCWIRELKVRLARSRYLECPSFDPTGDDGGGSVFLLN